MEDIILVTGCHHARSWTNICFNEVQSDTQASSGLQITENFGDPANWPVTDQNSQGTVVRHGPSGEVRVAYIIRTKLLYTFSELT